MDKNLKSLELFYREKRAVKFVSGNLAKGIHWRRLIHKIMFCGLKLQQKLSKVTVKIISDNINNRGKKPVIYACTHEGWKDVEIVYSAIKDFCYVFIGDPRNMYQSLDGLLLWLNGVIFLDTDCKQDRRIAKETGVQLLKKGVNLLIFPEGAFNITENEIVMPLFNGAAEMAIRGNADIVPLALEQFNNNFVINIGEKIDCSKYTINEKQQLTDNLHATLSALKYTIWEKYSAEKRSNVTHEYWQNLLNNIKSQAKGIYTLDEIAAGRFCKREHINAQQVFEHLNTITPNINNAFLFRKK